MPLVPRCPRVVLVALVVLTAARCFPVPLPAAAADAPRYHPPVDAPVIDGFRPPATPYGPGNRGLDYGTAPGTVVRAPADGRVTFAGLVAGTRHVTVLHDDGLRTTASYLDRIDVVVGQRVHQGDPLGTTTGQLHFSARNGDAYLDPASLFGDGPPHVRLVPFDEPPGSGERGERSAIRQLLGFFGHAAKDVAAAAQQTADWLQATAPDLVATAAHYGSRVLPMAQTLQVAISTFEAVHAAWDLWRRPCTPRSQPAPPHPAAGHVAVLVGGFGSTSEDAAVDDVDVDALGYVPGDILRFSYAGGRVPDARTGGALVSIPAHRYTSDDADGDLVDSGRRLADLIDEVVAAAPDHPIDLLAHSQGGLVARLALIELEARHGRAWLDHVGLLATLGSPHGGADLATAAEALDDTVAGADLLNATEQLLGIDADSDAVAQMSELSDLVQRLDDHPVPPDLHALSIGARGDLVVPLPRTQLEGAPEAVVPLDGWHAHDGLPSDDRTTRELALALAGAPPTCVGLGEALLDEGVGMAIGQVEDIASGGLWYASVAAEVVLPVLPPVPSPEEVHKQLGR